MNDSRARGITAALASATFLGLAPVFGKQAILLGAAPLAVVAIRTALAALLLLLLIAVFKRQYLFIYPAGLLGCLLAGWLNGLGSLFYYSALGRLDAGIGQLLYSLYPLLVALWMLLDHQQPNPLTLWRLALALPALYLLLATGHGPVDWIGVLEMLIAAGLYALHLPINQRVLYDMPAPTVTVYTLLAMSAIVVPTYLFSGSPTLLYPMEIWWPLIGLTVVTFFSRLTLFLGVKHIGGLQTAILGLGEVLVTVGLAVIWLGERLSVGQWLGGLLLLVSLSLAGVDKKPARRLSPGGWLSWLTPPLFNPSPAPQSHSEEERPPL